MAQSSRASVKILSAADTFINPIEVSGNSFNFSVIGTFVGTITIQRRFMTTGLYTEAWKDVSTYAEAKEDVGIIPREGVQYRAGFKTGGYTSGSATVRISQ